MLPPSEQTQSSRMANMVRPEAAEFFARQRRAMHVVAQCQFTHHRIPPLCRASQARHSMQGTSLDATNIIAATHCLRSGVCSANCNVLPLTPCPFPGCRSSAVAPTTRSTKVIHRALQRCEQHDLDVQHSGGTRRAAAHQLHQAASYVQYCLGVLLLLPSSN